MRLVGDLVLAGFGQIKNARIDNVSSDPVSPQNGQLWYNTTDGKYRGFDGVSVITFATGGSTATLQQEIDTLEASAGLDAAGNYVVETGSNYIADATTLAEADGLLDAAVKSVSDAVAAEAVTARAAEQVLTTAVSDEAARAALAEGNLTTALANEALRAVAAEQVLTDAVAAEAARAALAEGNLTTALANEALRAVAAEGVLTADLDAVELAFINKNGTVAFTGDQSMNSNKLTNVAVPTDNGDAANKAYVDGKISGLGNAFEYVAIVEGGADAASALDLALETITHAGAYYKVGVSGYFKVGAGDAFYANMHDGLVFNIASGVDLVDNTNSQVQGAVNFVEVTGSADTGYTVDVAANFKTRVSTLETGLSDETTRATLAEGNLTTALANEALRAVAAEQVLTDAVAAEAVTARAAEAAELARATAAELVLTTAVSDEAARAVAAELVLTNGLAAEAVTARAAELVLTDAVAAEAVTARAAELALTNRITAGQFLYEGNVAATSHTVTHNLGNKYNQVIVVDSNDKVIIPDAITFVSSNELIVDFISAITCKVVVSSPKA